MNSEFLLPILKICRTRALEGRERLAYHTNSIMDHTGEACQQGIFEHSGSSTEHEGTLSSVATLVEMVDEQIPWPNALANLKKNLRCLASRVAFEQAHMRLLNFSRFVDTSTKPAYQALLVGSIGQARLQPCTQQYAHHPAKIYAFMQSKSVCATQICSTRLGNNAINVLSPGCPLALSE